MRRAIVTALVLACVAASCGGGDDDDAGGDASSPAADSAAADDGAGSVAAPAATVVSDAGGDAQGASGGGGDVGGHGGISFTISGDQEKSGEWAFVPEASSFSSGWWAMSFTDPDQPVGTIITLSLDPTNQNITYGDADLTLTGMPPVCTFDIQSQDAGGASGTVECPHLSGFTVAGDNVDVALSANFDGTTGAGSMPDAAAAPADQPAATSAAAEQSAAAGAGGGQATVTVSGGHDADATWTFSPETSIFNSSWVMTFDDPTNPITTGGPFVTMSLFPDQPNLSFSDGQITIIDAAGQCDLQLDHQDAHGAAGSMSCTGVSAMGASSPVDISITFEGTV